MMNKMFGFCCADAGVPPITGAAHRASTKALMVFIILMDFLPRDGANGFQSNLVPDDIALKTTISLLVIE
jgi:hypothetical protein